MSKLDEIATRIIKEQERIIGPIAWQEAERVSGMHIVDRSTTGAVIDDPDQKNVVDKLVNQYEHFFGRAAREACKDAVASLLADLSPAEIPSSLQ